MNSLQIRHKFLQFFARNNHEIVSSSPLIPAQDPTLLFANAGMNQFKDLFLGLESRSYSRAVSIQKCVRAGGKHNDLDNVGFTRRHLTFFEMMGNFSFGDYFKENAIAYAWQFLTQELNFDKNSLHISVFETDDESYDIWLNKIGIVPHKIHRLGAKDNFWQMGDVGPCGPCTEIYFDREIPCTLGKDDCVLGCDCDRFLEIWNLVFMQFDRQLDGTLSPLKKTGVDTGMGLERLASILQHQDTVFTTDLFMPIIAKIEELTRVNYQSAPSDIQAAFHVLADHIRSCSLIIADGCSPTNEGRGYVLRKIIRRAALFTQKLTSKQTVFPELSRVVVAQFGEIYPELVTHASLIYNILENEIQKFVGNLVRGKVILERYLLEAQTTHIITGSQAFKLYDTYGFPIEITTAAAREQGYSVDLEQFEHEMAKQQEQSGKKTVDVLSTLDVGVETEFTGYQERQTASVVTALVSEDQVVDHVLPGQKVYIIAEKSPFFIVGGGQVPDQGWVVINEVKMPIVEVRFINKAIAACVVAQTKVSVNDEIISIVDDVWRTNAMKNHTATHLLQAALIELFGKQIQQSGSLVHPDYLRFDFTYHKQLTSEDIKKVEDIVNQKIRENIAVSVNYCSLKEAQKEGALAFFGEKYKPDRVRMIAIDRFSIELCGGTHVHSTGDIGTFKITDSLALSAGHRRILAVTGPRAIDLFQETFTIVKTIGQDFKIKKEEVLTALDKQKSQIKDLQQKVKTLKQQLIQAQLPLWQELMDYINGVPFSFIYFASATAEELRMITSMLEKKQPGFYCAASSCGEQTLFSAIVSSEYEPIVNMKLFIEWLKEHQGIRCGGTGNAIQGGGSQYNPQLADYIKEWIMLAGK